MFNRFKVIRDCKYEKKIQKKFLMSKPKKISGTVEYNYN